MTRYASSFMTGMIKPVRYRRGEGVNIWASKLNEIAHKLDAMDLPPEDPSHRVCGQIGRAHV